MNNEFQWRSEMRKLGGSIEPETDLWPGIAARLSVHKPVAVRRSRTRFAVAIAASLMVAVGAGLIGQRVLQTPAKLPIVEVSNNVDDRQHTALEWSQPSNPILASAAQDLDSASAKLQDALEQRPDAVFLVGLLNRTNSQRVRLMRQAPYAG